MELSRLLRRGLLVAAIAAAGWLLAVIFAGTASADEAPSTDTQTQNNHPGGLLTGLVTGLTGALNGVTNTVTGITESLVDTSGDAQQPAGDQTPIVDLPALLPGSASGSTSTDRAVSRVDAPAPVPVTRQPVVAPPAPAAPPSVQPAGSDQAGKGDPEPQPAKTPTSPANSGTTASSAHDNSGGARGAHGVLPAQTTLHPADAGFTTRSRAVDAAGRVAGLPASSPD